MKKELAERRKCISGCSFLLFYSLFFISLLSCSPQKKIGNAAKKDLLSVPELQTAHIGISVYEPVTNRYWYNYQGNKYFVPASSTKLFTCYAAMKYLTDSLPGIRYVETRQGLLLLPTGDPTLLHPDFRQQPVIAFLQKEQKRLVITDANWKDTPLGSGWAWDDFNSSYMVERSPLPVYGNLIKFVQTETGGNLAGLGDEMQTAVYTIPEINWKLRFSPDSSKRFYVERTLDDNIFTVTQGKEKYREMAVPFSTKGMASALELLKDTTGKEIAIVNTLPPPGSVLRTIPSQPTDSLLKPMMHRSDNFFAEQSLLMVSNTLLGVMNDGEIISRLLQTDYKDLPQKPRWVDGCGLSRYNLFSPQDLVWILNKMKKDFPWPRITNILATGNEGTLSGYYTADSSFIYAKTGTLSGQVAISGFLITKKKKTLIFSVLVNNHQSTATLVRRSAERFLEQLRERF
jgi:D-alanyl-D-alanine carboxypeptidase/D-alanyl-D-alanine-endopeptidase (penicillin-binding protein 4)